jgi:F-type H+-transporting ATPase subunit b
MPLTLLAAEGGSFTDVNIPTVLWAWVSFLVTLFALKKVAWPMLAAKMEERELRIAEGLRKAEEAEKRAKELMEKQEQILDEARKEAQKVLADGRAASENAKNDLLAAAQKEIEAQRERAKKEIGLERAKAVEELKRATVELTLEASARLLKREMRDEDHRRLAREVIDEVVTKR